MRQGIDNRGRDYAFPKVPAYGGLHDIAFFFALFCHRAPSAGHPIEEDYARPTKNAYRWRRLPKLRLVIGQFVSQYGVGVFVRGERGENPDMVEHRLRPYAAKFKKAVGVNKFFIVGGGNPPAKYFFQKEKSFNSSNPKNWNRMADWLHREADVYEAALYKIMGNKSRE